jgi:hypothetical protein
VSAPIAHWKERLGLAHRRTPELYEAPEQVQDVPHAPAIRAALEEMGLTAVFCVQGVPTVGILAAAADYDRAKVVALHAALWNQGLASLLLVVTNDTLRAFSLARTPLDEVDEAFESRCLIQTLNLAAEALRAQDLINGAESGRLWRDYSAFFRPEERIDQVLLDNLNVAHGLLKGDEDRGRLSSDAAQVVLIQTMFIAYLEDRGVVTPAYFAGVSAGQANSFEELLAGGDADAFRAFFKTLRADFNGDLFVAPCSFEPDAEAPVIMPSHLAVLARFRSGKEEMARSGQRRFWGYDFRFIPVELISAVYDRFLGEREKERRDRGAFYTPMFLADTVVSQVWDTLPNAVRATGRFLDPACGSGVFLVRSFQRLCEHWRLAHRRRSIPWNILKGLLAQIYGWDVNGGAVRVAVFSLYVALLEEVSPRDIRELIKERKLLPDLWKRTLVCQDFFDTPVEGPGFDVIIGNPPWTSRRGGARSSVQWSKVNNVPVPGGEDAWAFSWKALQHLKAGGVVAFLLPAMGFLHNHNTVEARRALFLKTRVRRVINFADLRFQLFEEAHRPTALIIYGAASETDFPYYFDYWAPKADLNLRIKRVITLSTADRSRLPVADVLDNPLVFKQRLWMREPEAKLFAFLDRLPKLGRLVTQYGSLSRARREAAADEWVIGSGFQRYNPPKEGQEDPKNAGPQLSAYVGRLPNLPVAAFSRLYQSAAQLRPASSTLVRRRGFERGFDGSRILLGRGVERGRLRAAYCRDPLTFEDILLALAPPEDETVRAKLLAALLSSRVAIWYAFHGTASFGVDRPELKASDFLRLPFPEPSDLADPQVAQAAADSLVAIIDLVEAAALRPFGLRVEDDQTFEAIDGLAYQYFGLSTEEIAIIEDTVETIVPALQPHEGYFPRLWSIPRAEERQLYAETLAASLSDWFSGGAIEARLIARSADLAILRLRLDHAAPYAEEAEDGDVGAVLQTLSDHINRPLDGNFQLTPDLRVFVGDRLYLVKPMQLRFWLRSTALADADAIALDLQQASAVDLSSRGRA